MKLRLYCPPIDYLVQDQIKLICKTQSQNFKKLNSEEKLNLEVFLKEKLIKEYLPSEFNKYNTSHDYSSRCSFLERACYVKETQIIQTLINRFNAQRPEYQNVFVISDDFFGEIVNTFNSETMFNWDIISEQQDLPWTSEIIHAGRFLWDWSKLQVNPATSTLLCSFKIIDNYSELLDWDLISRDTRLTWTSTEINKFKNKIFFNIYLPPYVDYQDKSESFIRTFNYFLPTGFSSRPDLTEKIIDEFQNYFNWRELSSNPYIGINREFIEKYFSRIDFYRLCHNKSLNLDVLRFMKVIYAFSNKEISKMKFNGIERTWDFYWIYAFENANINWSFDIISEFEQILNEKSTQGGSNWDGLSKNINNKSLILYYKDKLNALTIAYYNPDIQWDIELTEFLLTSIFKFSIFDFGDNLPNISRKINITKEAILYFKDVWLKNYYVSQQYHGHSDNTEAKIFEIPLWHCLKENNNITWVHEFDLIFNKKEMNIIIPSIQLLRFTKPDFEKYIIGNTFICRLKNIPDNFPAKNNFKCIICDLELATNEPHMPFSLIVKIDETDIRESIEIMNIERLDKFRKEY